MWDDTSAQSAAANRRRRKGSGSVEVRGSKVRIRASVRGPGDPALPRRQKKASALDEIDCFINKDIHETEAQITGRKQELRPELDHARRGTPNTD